MDTSVIQSSSTFHNKLTILNFLWCFNQSASICLHSFAFVSVDPDLNPMTTEEIVQMFNELRSDLVLLYELKQAHSNCEYEQQMLRHRYEALLKAGSGGGSGGITGSGLAATTQSLEFNATNSTTASTPGGESLSWPSADDIKVEAKEQIIDVVGAPLTPNSVSLHSLDTNSLKPSADWWMYLTKLLIGLLNKVSTILTNSSLRDGSCNSKS